MARAYNVAGEVTTDISQHKAAMKAAGQEITRFNETARRRSRQFRDSMQQATRSSGRFTQGIQNAAFQVGDFAVQVGGGTSAVRAMSMQLPQLLGGFGVFGAVAGAAVAIIGPLAQGLFDSADGASEAEQALSGLTGRLNTLQGYTRDLASLQETLNNAQRAQASASAAGTSAVLANAKVQAEAKRDLIRLEQTLTRLEARDARMALRALESQQQAYRDMVAEQVRTLGPGSTDSRNAGSGGFAGGGLSYDEILQGAGITPEMQRQSLERQKQIQLLQIELGKVAEIAAEADAALNGVFTAGEVAGGGSSTVDRVRQVQVATEEMTESVKRSLDDQLNEYGTFFGSLESVFEQGNKRMLQVAKTAGAAESLINAYRAATQALADPTVGFWGKAAAYASVLATGLGAVNAIRSANISSGGGSSASAASGGAAAAANNSPRVAVTLNGSENAMYGKDQIRGLINSINEAVEDGAIIRLA